MIGIFLDSETNGLNPFKHRLLEISFKIVSLSDGKEICSYSTIICQNESVWKLSDPESLAINGFTREKCLSGINEQNAKNEIIDIFKSYNIERKKAVFICQNPAFDKIFFSQLIDPDIQEQLNWPYHWLDLASMFWVTQLHKHGCVYEKSLSKDAIALSYGLPPEIKPHTALGGVDHLLLCYKAVAGFPQNN